MKDPTKLMQVMIDKGDPSRAEMDEKERSATGLTSAEVAKLEELYGRNVARRRPDVNTHSADE